MTADNQQIYADFKNLVNLSKPQLSKWLQTDQAKSIGIKSGTINDKKTSPDGPKSIGYKSGEAIVKILGKKQSDFTDDDYWQMRRVTGYIKRHLAQEPIKQNIEQSRWRYSLMNWGHDPLKD